jgi:NADH:ubiquinone oxidoreductase subunit C
MTAVDYPENNDRFEVVYNLTSVVYQHRVRVKTLVNETTPLPSLTSLYDGVN